MVYGIYNELVTGANLNQQTSRLGAPHCMDSYELTKNIVRSCTQNSCLVVEPYPSEKYEFVTWDVWWRRGDVPEPQDD